MKTLQHLLFPIALLLLAGCSEDTPTEEALEENDYRFEDIYAEEEIKVLTKYASNTLLSIELADLAAQRAKNPKVKALAKKIAKDHRVLYDELETLADNYEMVLPRKLSEEKQATIEMLKSQDGHPFDEMYLSTVTSYHQAFKDKMEDIMQETVHDEMLKLARAVDSHSYVHLNEAKSLKMELSS